MNSSIKTWLWALCCLGLSTSWSLAAPKTTPSAPSRSSTVVLRFTENSSYWLIGLNGSRVLAPQSVTTQDMQLYADLQPLGSLQFRANSGRAKRPKLYPCLITGYNLGQNILHLKHYSLPQKNIYGVLSQTPGPSPSVKMLSTHLEAPLAQLVQQYFQSQDLAPNPIQVQQRLAVDLNNDGQEEQLIVLDNRPDASWLAIDPAATPNQDRDFGQMGQYGDYSAILLYRPALGTLSPVVASIPNRADSERNEVYQERYRLGLLADLNRDGVLEIITEDTRFEGYGNSVYTWKNQNTWQRLAESWIWMRCE